MRSGRDLPAFFRASPLAGGDSCSNATGSPTVWLRFLRRPASHWLQTSAASWSGVLRIPVSSDGSRLRWRAICPPAGVLGELVRGVHRLEPDDPRRTRYQTWIVGTSHFNSTIESSPSMLSQLESGVRSSAAENARACRTSRDAPQPHTPSQRRPAQVSRRWPRWRWSCLSLSPGRRSPAPGLGPALLASRGARIQSKRLLRSPEPRTPKRRRQPARFLDPRRHRKMSRVFRRRSPRSRPEQEASGGVAVDRTVGRQQKRDTTIAAGELWTPPGAGSRCEQPGRLMAPRSRGARRIGARPSTPSTGHAQNS